jgi:hypothetical protein
MSSDSISVEKIPNPASRVSGGDDLLARIAVDLYQIGSMILGEGEDTIGLIERAVVTTDVSSASTRGEARHNSRLSLAAGAIDILSQRNPQLLSAPESDSGPASCIEDDELDAAGVSHAELEEMITGSDSQRLRTWLEGLSPQLRIVFVLRAVAGLSSAEVGGLLAEHGGLTAEGWTPDAVRGTFRQALCSLASQLLHASNVR